MNENKSPVPAQEFPRTKPLKKRPVDSSLFPALEYTQGIENSHKESIYSPTYIGSSSSHSLGLADTQSVVEAAMEALIRSDRTTRKNNESPIVIADIYNVTKNDRRLYDLEKFGHNPTRQHGFYNVPYYF